MFFNLKNTMLNLQNMMHKFEKTDLHVDIGIEIILRSSKNAEHDEHEHILETVAFDAAEDKPPRGLAKKTTYDVRPNLVDLK